MLITQVTADQIARSHMRAGIQKSKQILDNVIAIYKIGTKLFYRNTNSNFNIQNHKHEQTYGQIHRESNKATTK